LSWVTSVASASGYQKLMYMARAYCARKAAPYGAIARCSR
jgi:hypothetical protein